MKEGPVCANGELRISSLRRYLPTAETPSPFKALSDYLSSKIDQLSKWYTRSHATKHGHQKQTDAAASPKEPLSNKSLGIERIESIGLARESQSGIHTDSSGSKFAQA